MIGVTLPQDFVLIQFLNYMAKCVIFLLTRILEDIFVGEFAKLDDERVSAGFLLMR